MFKSEYQIFYDFIGFLNKSLAKLGYTDWSVQQQNQPSKREIEDKTLYVSWIASRRIGWQKHADFMENNVLKHYEGYVEEIMFQLSAFKLTGLEDNVATLTCNDVVNRLVSFLQSQAGVRAFRALGYSVPRISNIRQLNLTTDSDQYEKMVSVDISVFLVQNEIEDIESTAEYNINLKGI